MSKILHVTTELFEFNIGGIGIICNLLYDNRLDEDFLLILKQKPSNYKDLENVKITTMSKSAYWKYRNYDKVFFHNFEVAYESVKANRKLRNAYYVIHSNVIMEAVLGTSFTEEQVDKFISVLRNMNIVTVSEYDYELLKSTLVIYGISDIDLSKVRVIYNGISLNDEKPEFSINRNNIIGYLGRLDTRKGIVESTEIMSRSKYNYLVAGGGLGKFDNKIIESISPFVSKNINVKYIGYCTGKRKQTFLSTIDCMLVPSLYEPFGMTILECLKAGKLPIVNNLGSFKEILGEDYPFVFDMNKPSTILSVLDDFYSYDDETLSKIFDLAYSRMSENFNSDIMLKSYREIDI